MATIYAPLYMEKIIHSNFCQKVIHIRHISRISRIANVLPRSIYCARVPAHQYKLSGRKAQGLSPFVVCVYVCRDSIGLCGKSTKCGDFLRFPIIFIRICEYRVRSYTYAMFKGNSPVSLPIKCPFIVSVGFLSRAAPPNDATY